VHALRALRAGDRRQDELGLAGRGEKAEIVSFVNQMLESELSGKHDRPVPGRRPDLRAVPLHGADLGAVAAQVDFAADGLGSNLVVQVESSRA